jgi:hypothetical protein
MPLVKFRVFRGFKPEIRSRNIIRIISTTDFADLLIIEERIFVIFLYLCNLVRQAKTGFSIDLKCDQHVK